MEHRNGSRIPLSLPVELFSQGTSHGNFMLSNIGQGGFLLNCQGKLKKREVLSAKITSNVAGSPQYYWLKVMVAHSSEQGAGLMWVDNNRPFFNALDFMVSSAA